MESIKNNLYNTTKIYYNNCKIIQNLLNKDDYINDIDISKIEKLDKTDKIKLNIIQKIVYYKLYNDYKKYKQIYIKYKKNIEKDIIKHNDVIAGILIEKNKDILGKIENNYLDNNQLDAIVRDNDNHLILAGAGSGKTTTIIGKVKYLLLNNKCEKDEILLLSFTKKSSSEMKERIKKEIGYDLDVFTFHKLGLEIIKKYNKSNIKITDITLSNFIKKELNKLLQDNNYLKLFIDFLLYHRFSYKDEFSFKTKEEYIQYKHNYPPYSIKDKHTSYAEAYIANYLFLNHINYVYNAPFKSENMISNFYLPDYDIYIEYYDISKDNKIPKVFIDDEYKLTLYIEKMEHKRKLHKKYKTKNIECYLYELNNNTLLTNLEKKLDKFNVDKKIDLEDSLNQIIKYEPNILNGVIELFETVINLLKSKNYSIEDAIKINKITNEYIIDNNIILSLIKPILERYNDYLRCNNEIDFNDMINMATYYIKKNKYIHNYKYVIVDEYQDISYSRYNLLKELRNNKFYKLFCVGDDYQSIYRFSGSDIGLIIDFSKYYSRAYISKINKTYRFTNKLIEISNNFILKNPKQIKKDIIGKVSTTSVLGIIEGKTFKSIVAGLEDKLNNIKPNSTVFLLGRYTNDIKILDSSTNFIYDKNNITGNMKVTYKGNTKINLEYLTIHRSKGLQADYVFILNNKKKGMGFPSSIEDLPIIYMLLDKADDYKYAEERRLFYVALTRAKHKVYLLSQTGNESVFIKELKKDYGNYIEKEKNECPICGNRIIKKHGPYGDYYTCENKECKYIKKYK